RKFQHRLARLEIYHPHAVPVGRRVDPRAERLGEGLLGGKALCEVGNGLPVGAEALEFGLAENAPREALAEPLQCLVDPLDFDQIGADAVNHRAASVIRRFISRTASRMPTNTARDTMACPMCSSRTPGRRATGSTLK